MKFLKIIGAFIVAIIALSLFSTMCEDSNVKVDPVEPEANWSVKKDVDGMTDDSITLYYNTSVNEEFFEFPYDGGSNLQIVIRKDSKRTDAIIKITKGQFNISTFGEESIDVKFDDGPVVKYKYTMDTNGEISHVYLKDSKGFISKLKKAKTAKLSPPFFQSGQKVFEFNVEGLEL